MKGITFSAWRDGHYVGLAELLLVLGYTVLDFTWKLDIGEVAPGQQSAPIEAWDSEMQVGTLHLLQLFAPDVQIIDGKIEGYTLQDFRVPIIVLRAVDGSSWDVESELDEAIHKIRIAYPDAMDLPT